MKILLVIFFLAQTTLSLGQDINVNTNDTESKDIRVIDKWCECTCWKEVDPVSYMESINAQLVVFKEYSDGSISNPRKIDGALWLGAPIENWGACNKCERKLKKGKFDSHCTL